MNIKLSSSLSIFIFFLPILRFRSHTLMASQKAYERKPHSYNLILCVTIRNTFYKNCITCNCAAREINVNNFRNRKDIHVI